MAATATTAQYDTTTSEGKVAAMQARFPEVDPRILVAYLKYKKDDLEQAIALHEVSLGWLCVSLCVSVLDLERYMY